MKNEREAEEVQATCDRWNCGEGRGASVFETVESSRIMLVPYMHV